ncbi:YhcN/YlaJ family sporulation lipoprotein [Rossellomorea sp. YC4-1]|jgi:YhcN/YlaJ family sporulation lipoprotein|nr:MULTISPECIES: YhcN/YlaJ family sporulation lipoprotein [Rossellomorea]MDT9023777.1 YhcN/YlaJ family sporulation lipoprotein [Rossellomorea sp. YC4-1]
MPPAPDFLLLLYVANVDPVIPSYSNRTARFLKYMNKRIKIEENYTIRKDIDSKSGGIHMFKLISLLMVTIILGACANKDEVGYDNDSNSNNNKPITVQDSNIQHVERKSGQQISRHLVDLTTSVPDVKDATAVVFGKYAFVGIDIDSDIERSQVGSIKYSVAEALQKDPYGAEAIVIADPDLYARLNEISKDIQRGEPVQGIMNELADISGRLMPEIPRSLKQADPENAPNEPKKKMNNTKEKQLKEKQENQTYDKIE